MSDLAARIASLPPEKRALLERRLSTGRSSLSPAAAVSRRPAPGPAPLSFAQRRLWFLDRLDPGGSLYNVPEAFVLRGPLQREALEKAIREILRRHEVLRTSFGGGNGEPLARVEEVAIELPVADLTGLPPSEREGHARDLAEAEAVAPFDLGRAPLLRAKLLRLGPEEHWLLLTMHHVVSDDWSMGVLYSELEELYDAYSNGTDPVLSELPLQYADYAAWQRDWLRGETLAGQLSFWKRHLSGEVPVLDLPTDRPRPPVQSFRGADVRRKLPRSLSAGLEMLSRSENATLFMTLLAAFQVLVGRFCGQDDIPVGTPIAGRNRVETEGLIGFFVNTLVLRGDLSSDPSFRDLLRKTREIALAAYDHQDLPFEKLVEELRPERSLSHSPLFQVMFELDNAPGEALRLRGLDVQPLELPDASAKFDLRLLAIDEDGQLELVFEYASDLFEEATIARMADCFETLLQGIVADPSVSTSRLPLLPAEQTRLLLVEWNATEREYPRQKTLHELFHEQADRTPDAVAVEHGDRRLTYRGLEERSAELAQRLRDLGAGPGVLVGISLERSIELVVGLLATLESGAAYVPLDPTYPERRLAFMLEDARIPILVTESSLLESLPPIDGLQVVCLDAGRAGLAVGTAAPRRARPDDAAYVLYTSGSTGTPKGVVIPHRAIVNHMAWMLREFPLLPGDAVVQKTPMSFDASVWEFWAPLLSGARLVMAGPQGHHDTSDLIATIRRHGVTVLQVVPSLLAMLLEDPDLHECRSLKRVFCGGSPLPPDAARRLVELLPVDLVNLYGPTEATIDSVFWLCRNEGGTRPIPIGRPVSNTRAYVMGPKDQLVPIGVSGELWIGGEGLALGYLGRPELTAEKFTADPMRAGEASRVYRTGDRARWRSDGVVEFLGRIDDQVKIRGVRIELGEIEAALRACPGVLEAVVSVREETPWDRRLVAYFVSRPGHPVAPEELHRALAEILPDYMVPSAFLELEGIPRLPNGKLDRKGLPAPDPLRRQVGGDYQSPQDALELQLTKIWEAVLGAGPVGLDDNFFDLGGHSLLAVRLFAEIEKATGRRLSLSSLFLAPTVRQFAELVRERGGGSSWTSLMPIQAAGSRPPFYCVHAAGGGVVPYRSLAQRLGPDQPFYGLQARALVDDSQIPKSVEEMAGTYVSEIRSLQPSGPYYLGGHSAGGTVAYEMACRLVAEGERVAFVALFDTWAPGHGDLIPEKFFRLMLTEVGRRLVRFYRGIRREAPVAYLKEKLAIRAKVLLGRASDVPRELQAVRESIESAAENYRPSQRYPGRLTLFRARRQPPEYALDRTLGWSAFAADGVDVHTVPGYHGEVVDEPQAAILAEKLRECLHRAVEAEDGAETAPRPA